MIVRLAGIDYESMANGPGLRRVFFAQGCKHRCKGCFNPSTHSKDGGIIFSTDALVEEVKDCSILNGVTFSGGDPFEQAPAFATMAEKLKALGLNIWCYTGYKFEEIWNSVERPGFIELLLNVDVLVDGKFEEENHDENLLFKGSSNQRIIDVKESLKQDKIILWRNK